jgi:sarcosine oxidase subunit alpha
MTDRIEIVADGVPLRARAGTSVAVALLEAGVTSFRASVTGEPRAPVCGMGSCFECRVVIDGIAHRRACLVIVRPGMTVTTTGSRP